MWALLLAAAPAFAQEAGGGADGHERDVIYGRKNGLALTLDVYRARGASKRRAVIYVVSSGWFSDVRAHRSRRYDLFRDRGYTVFSVVHGSTPKYTIAEIAPDIHRAVRFIRHNAARFAIDPDRIAILGASAGGHLSLLIGASGAPGDPKARDEVERSSSRVQVVGAFFPPTDFLNWGKPGLKVTDTEMMKRFRAPFDFRTFDRLTNAYVSVEDPTPILRALSPIEHVSPDDPPMILVHGTSDPLVPFQQSQLMFAALEQAGVKTRLIPKEGKSHGWLGMGEDLRTIAGWFDEHLDALDAKRKKEALPEGGK